MHKLNARTLSIMSGLLLLTMLPACAHHPAPLLVDKPVPVVVTVKDTPPAELTRCADRPEGLPEDRALLAQIPSMVRAAFIRMARSFAGNASQLDRLVNWNVPGSCGGKAK
jgi:hypothetical protein